MPALGIGYRYERSSRSDRRPRNQRRTDEARLNYGAVVLRISLAGQCFRLATAGNPFATKSSFTESLKARPWPKRTY